MESLYHFFTSVMLFFSAIFGVDNSVITEGSYTQSLEKIVKAVASSSNSSPKAAVTTTDTVSQNIKSVERDRVALSSSSEVVAQEIERGPCENIVEYDVFKGEGAGSFDLHRPCQAKDWNKKEYTDYSVLGNSYVYVGDKMYAFFYQPDYAKCNCGLNWVGYLDTGLIYQKDMRRFIASSSLQFFYEIFEGTIHVETILFPSSKSYVVLVDAKNIYLFYPGTKEFKKLYAVPEHKMLCSQEIACFPSVDVSDDGKSLFIEYREDDNVYDVSKNGSTTVFLP